ncbi:type I secretion outer membrane protein, TolC family [Moraxella caviae]|nr:type I secretion outer membrane protein, TolC family [Moraxella caviae]VEW10457.1 type I secretion outer membrane protein, TolC family [Moraxella caviae]
MMSLAAGFTQLAVAAINPLEVNGLIGHAVQTHPLVGAARADKDAAAEGVTAAKLGLLPTPSLSTQHAGNDGTITSLAIRQPLWTGGRLTADINRAMYDDKAAVAGIMERQNEVAKNTIDIWQSYIYALSLKELYAKNLEQLADFEAMMQRRVAQGASAKIDLDLVTNRILQDQNSLQGAIEQQRIAEARLEQLVGQPIGVPTQSLPLSQMAKEAKSQSVNFGQLAFGDMSANHPSVIRQHFEVEAARHEVKSQRASRYPSVYAQYTNEYRHRGGKHEDDLMIGLSYDPGAGFSSLALARASEARVQSLMQSQEAARRSAMEAIQTQYQQFVSARDQELSLTAAVGGAQIVLNSYRRQFIAGKKSWLEVLNAVREQSQYEQQLRQVQAQMVASFYKLQVDFGLMPWQQNYHADPATHEEFSPLAQAKDWTANTMQSLTHQNSPSADTSSIARDGVMWAGADDNVANVDNVNGIDNVNAANEISDLPAAMQNAVQDVVHDVSQDVTEETLPNQNAAESITETAPEIIPETVAQAVSETAPQAVEPTESAETLPAEPTESLPSEPAETTLADTSSESIASEDVASETILDENIASETTTNETATETPDVSETPAEQVSDIESEAEQTLVEQAEQTEQIPQVEVGLGLSDFRNPAQYAAYLSSLRAAEQATQKTQDAKIGDATEPSDLLEQPVEQSAENLSSENLPENPLENSSSDDLSGDETDNQ